jgi:hypothetical protein
MHCPTTIFVDKFWDFSTFSVVLLVLGRPECSSSSSNTRPASNVNAVQKPLSGLMKHFTGFGSGFTELHAKLDTDILLDFAIHRRQN